MKRLHLAIVARHAEEAPFLWARRDRAARSPAFDLASLREIDERLDANLEGLALAGAPGLAAARASLAQAERRTTDVGGEVFAVAQVAAEIGDAAVLAQVLARAGRRPEEARAVVSALGWLSAEAAARVLGEMAGERAPAWLSGFALRAYAVRREDPGDLLARALGAEDAALASHAQRAAGELARRDLLPRLLRGGGTGAKHMPWAAWSAALLGDVQDVEALWAVAEAGGPHAEAFAEMAARAGDPGATAARLLALSRRPDGLPAALAGAAARGDPACVPWVLAALSSRPEVAHRAAWVYATITGAALAPPLAVRVPTMGAGAPDIAARRRDVNRDLPAPDAEAIEAHWAGVTGLAPGERYLGGRRLDQEWLGRCLRVGAQPWRRSAAVELLRQGAPGPLFPVEAPARRQAARLRAEGSGR